MALQQVLSSGILSSGRGRPAPIRLFCSVDSMSARYRQDIADFSLQIARRTSYKRNIDMDASKIKEHLMVHAQGEGELNHYALKVHRFLKGWKPKSSYSSRKLSRSWFDGLRWCSRYSATNSSVKFPVLHAPYPIAQKCFPQYRFCNSGYSCCNSLEVRPFNRLMISLIDFDAGYSMCMWTWSLLTTPLRILMSSVSQIWMISSRHRFCTSPLRTW